MISLAMEHFQNLIRLLICIHPLLFMCQDQHEKDTNIVLNSEVCTAQSCLTLLGPHGLQPIRLLCLADFTGKLYSSGVPFPPPGDLPKPGIEPTSPALTGRFFTTKPPGKHFDLYTATLFHVLASTGKGLIPKQLLILRFRLFYLLIPVHGPFTSSSVQLGFSYRFHKKWVCGKATPLK